MTLIFGCYMFSDFVWFEPGTLSYILFPYVSVSHLSFPHNATTQHNLSKSGYSHDLKQEIGLRRTQIRFTNCYVLNINITTTDTALWYSVYSYYSRLSQTFNCKYKICCALYLDLTSCQWAANLPLKWPTDRNIKCHTTWHIWWWPILRLDFTQLLFFTDMHTFSTISREE